MMRALVVLGLIGMLAVGANAASFIIDTFSDVGAPNPWPMTTTTVQVMHAEESSLPTVIGGRRDTRMNVTAVYGGISEQFTVSGGIFSSAMTDQGQAVTELSYGLYQNAAVSPWTVGPTGSATDADWSGETGILMIIPAVDLNGQVQVKINAGGNEYTQAFPISGPGNLPIPFASFGAGLVADLGDVDGVSFAFSGPIAWDVSVDMIRSYKEENIPEPFTMALMGLGVAGLGGYIRRRR